MSSKSRDEQMFVVIFTLIGLCSIAVLSATVFFCVRFFFRKKNQRQQEIHGKIVNELSDVASEHPAGATTANPILTQQVNVV